MKSVVSLSESQLLWTMLALALVLLTARTFGDLARRAHQPEVLGQLVGGFLLGPSVLGALLPNVRATIFLSSGPGLVLSGISWLGAIFLLLVAGMEVDMAILRQQIKPGTVIAASAIVPSIGAGILFVLVTAGGIDQSGLFLGTVLSVTAVTVAAQILLEREATRREYAQIVLAAGVISEVVVWLLVSVESPSQGGSPVLRVVEHGALAVAFFVFVVFFGRRLVFWLMRRVGDFSRIGNGHFSLVLVLTLLVASLSQVLGLHPLLGAFVLGVVLGQSPRTNDQMLTGIHSLVLGMLAPVFFVLAGMRVDILQLNTVGTILTTGFLLALATTVKVGFSTVTSQMLGRRWAEAALVGLGLNLKGATDVVVAIVGVTLALLSPRMYTMYAVIAIATVLISPPLMSWLERRAPASEEEQTRLDAEAAEQGAYTRQVERVLIPVTPELQPDMVATVLQSLAKSKNERQQTFDITSLSMDGHEGGGQSESADRAHEALGDADKLSEVELTRQQAGEDGHLLEEILTRSDSYDLVAIGSIGCRPGKSGSLGRLQEKIVQDATSDVLVISGPENGFSCENLNTILVPVNGLEYSMSAGDLAASLAHACDAELVALSLVRADPGSSFWRERDRRHLLNAGSTIAEDLTWRVGRLGVSVEERVEVAERPDERIVRELKSGRYDLVVLGAINRSRSAKPHLGRTVHAVLSQSPVPALILISREGEKVGR